MNCVCRQYGGRELLYAYFPVMHTRCDLLLWRTDPQVETRRAAERIQDRLVGIERVASYFDPCSELSRVNAGAAAAPVVASSELLTMIRICLDGHKRTGGLFDITVRSEHHRPTTAERIRIGEQRIFYEEPGLKIDLSGFVKGYALDRVREILREEGVTDALVNLGNSSVYACGSDGRQEGWRIGYNGCFGAAASTPGIVLKDRFLTTSGNDSPTRRHIVDPRTGVLREGRGAVGVVTQSGATGEMLSTSLFLAGEPQRHLLAERFGKVQYYELT